MPKPERRYLMCPITEDERREFGAELARATAEQQRLEADKKAAMTQFKNEIDEQQSLCLRMSRYLTTGEIERLVDCTVHVSRDEERVRVIRLDTGEVIEDREMTNSERQMALL